MNRRRRYWLIGWFPISLFVLIGAILLVWEIIDRELQYGKSADSLAAAIRETDAIDPNWRWEALDATRPEVPDDENIVKQIELIYRSANQLGNRRGLASNLTLEEVAPNQLHSPEFIALLEEQQKRCEPGLTIARNLHQFEKGRYRVSLPKNPLTMGLGQFLQEGREVLTLLRNECIRLGIENRPAEAVHLIHGMVNTAQASRDALYLMDHLLRNAGRATVVDEIQRLLGRTEPGAALQELIEPLEKMSDKNHLIWGIRGERAWSHRVFELWEQDEGELVRWIDQSRDFGLIRKPVSIRNYRPFLKQDHATKLRFFNRMIETFELPLYEQVEAVNRLRLLTQDENSLDALMASPGVNSLDALIASPGGEQILEAERRGTALIDSARVAIAAELFRHENQRWPKDLQEIPQKWLKEIPVDPYDGKPMRYRIEEEGIVIYSVGADQIDQQGQLDLRPARGNPGDLGIRLWNPNKRRLPPPPPQPELLEFPDELVEPEKE